MCIVFILCQKKILFGSILHTLLSLLSCITKLPPSESSVSPGGACTYSLVLGAFTCISSSDDFSFVVSVDLVLVIVVLNMDLKEVKGCATEEKRELSSFDLARTSLGRDSVHATTTPNEISAHDQRPIQAISYEASWLSPWLSSLNM
jgi:hypothetical protein